MVGHPSIRLPKQWSRHVKAGVLHAISLASVAMSYARGRATGRRRLRAQLDQATTEISLLREELSILEVQINEEKTKLVDLRRNESFSFVGFEFRRVKTRRGKWGVRATPKMRARSRLLETLRNVFRRYRSQPITKLTVKINQIVRGWVNYFRIGDSGRCFTYVRFWIEKI